MPSTSHAQVLLACLIRELPVPLSPLSPLAPVRATLRAPVLVHRVEDRSVAPSDGYVDALCEEVALLQSTPASAALGHLREAEGLEVRAERLQELLAEASERVERHGLELERWRAVRAELIVLP